MDSYSTISKYFVFGIALVLSVIFPWLLILIASVGLFSLGRVVGASLLLFLFLVSFFVYVNFGKDFSGDYVWYFEHYEYWVSGPFNVPFEMAFQNVYARYTEPVYHVMSFTLARLFGGSKFAFDFYFTFLIYFLVFISVLKLCFDRFRNSWVLYFLCLSLFFLCLNPATLTHLIRQNIAGAFLLLSFVLLLKQHRLGFLLFSTISLLTHSSVLIPLILFSIIYFFVDFLKLESRGYFIGFFFAVALGLVSPYLAIVLGGQQEILYRSDGDISYFVYIFDFLLIFSSAFFVKRLNEKYYVNIFVYAAFFYLLTLFSFSSELLHLRLYLLFDFFRIPLFFVLFVGLSRIRYGYLFGLLFLFAGIANVVIRFSLTPFDFGGSFIQLFVEFIFIGLLNFV